MKRIFLKMLKGINARCKFIICPLTRQNCTASYVRFFINNIQATISVF